MFNQGTKLFRRIFFRLKMVLLGRSIGARKSVLDTSSSRSERRSVIDLDGLSARSLLLVRKVSRSLALVRRDIFLPATSALFRETK